MQSHVMFPDRLLGADNRISNPNARLAISARMCDRPFQAGSTNEFKNLTSVCAVLCTLDASAPDNFEVKNERPIVDVP
jgi:hypothetical protein